MPSNTVPEVVKTSNHKTIGVHEYADEMSESEAQVAFDTFSPTMGLQMLEEASASLKGKEAARAAAIIAIIKDCGESTKIKFGRFLAGIDQYTVCVVGDASSNKFEFVGIIKH